MGTPSESEFAQLIDTLAADPQRREGLTEWLREDHPVYHQRGTATVVRMRGWILLALARAGVSEKSLLFVLEELDNGIDPYLVAAAARALRSAETPSPAFAPLLMRALDRIRYRDDPVSFAGYGAYAVSSDNTSPVRELLKTLSWLGPSARGVLPELEAIKSERNGGLSKKLLPELDLALTSIKSENSSERRESDACCSLPQALTWPRSSRRSSGSIESTTFEDQEGERITFQEFFRGQPSIVVFFYTRCDNPLKCSLTIAKLARVQKLLAEQGLGDQISTAAITYDPEFDLPKRIRVYGHDRGVSLNARNRMLRTTAGFDALRKHFRLGVNFIESLVNRHRIEAYVLDAEGRIAARFERLRWDEQEVVDRAATVLNESSIDHQLAVKGSGAGSKVTRTTLPALGTIASLGVAFFPKCPICWAAYLSMFGVAGLNQIPYSPWLQPVLIVLMLINLASVWLRSWFTGRMLGSYLVTAGAFVILVSKIWPAGERAVMLGVILTFAGSLLSAAGSITKRKQMASS
jgi:protein SCO1/2